MDTLTFNSPIILRHLTFSEARKLPIDVIRLDLALEGLELTMEQVRCLLLAFSCMSADYNPFRSSSSICVFCADVTISNH